MADTVRYLMEEMVPELEDMVKQQYFSRAEVKQIVKRRQDFEYLLKRKATLKEDYLRYVCCVQRVCRRCLWSWRGWGRGERECWCCTLLAARVMSV